MAKKPQMRQTVGSPPQKEKTRPLAHPHDSGYKLLFSHPALVADLLSGFVAEDWVKELDFATLEKQPGSYVSDDLRPRADDVVWRVRWRDHWLYVYLLLEFQSSSFNWKTAGDRRNYNGSLNDWSNGCKPRRKPACAGRLRYGCGTCCCPHACQAYESKRCWN